MSVLERGATSISIIACDFEKRRTNSSTPVRGEKPRFIQSSNSTGISHLRGQAFYRESRDRIDSIDVTDGQGFAGFSLDP